MVPLAVASFLVCRGLRSLLLGAHVARRPHPVRGGAWTTGSEMIEKNPLGFFLPYMIGPRWNCHALTAGAGPLRVHHSIELAGPFDTVASWTVAVCDARFRTVGMLSNAAGNETDVTSRRLDLRPGSYTLFLRSYGDGTSLALPEVQIDGKRRVSGGIRADEGDRHRSLLTRIRDRDAFAYRALQYHAFYAVRERRRLPEAWARLAFLPAGNPETEFLFGSISRGDRLRVRVASPSREAARVYACLYNESSFPMEWAEIAGAEGTIGPAAREGAYLVRIVSRSKPAYPRAKEDLARDVETILERVD